MTHNNNESSPETILLPQSECFVFLESAETDYTPASGYEEYCRRRTENGLQPPAIYISTTITSGGYRRYVDLPVGVAIESNSRLARQIVDEGLLAYGLSPELVVLPSELGKVPGWKQTDYLQFWMYVIRALDPDAAHALQNEWFRNEETDLPTIGEQMENAPTYDERRMAYIAFVKQYWMLLKQEETASYLTPRWQAPAVIPGLDNIVSLGCSAEYYFAQMVLPSWFLEPNSEELRQSMRQLIGDGAMIAGRNAQYEQQTQAGSDELWRRYYQGTK